MRVISIELDLQKEKKFLFCKKKKKNIRLRDIERGNVRKRLSDKFKTINEYINPIESGTYPI
jgi:hypothetical protein